MTMALIAPDRPANLSLLVAAFDKSAQVLAVLSGLMASLNPADAELNVKANAAFSAYLTTLKDTPFEDSAQFQELRCPRKLQGHLRAATTSKLFDEAFDRGRQSLGALSEIMHSLDPSDPVSIRRINAKLTTSLTALQRAA